MPDNHEQNTELAEDDNHYKYARILKHYHIALYTDI